MKKHLLGSCPFLIWRLSRDAGATISCGSLSWFVLKYCLHYTEEFWNAPEFDHLKGCQQICTSCQRKREEHTQLESSRCLMPGPDRSYKLFQDVPDSRWTRPNSSHQQSCRKDVPRGVAGDRELVLRISKLFLTLMAVPQPFHLLAKKAQDCSLGGLMNISEVCQDMVLYAC